MHSIKNLLLAGSYLVLLAGGAMGQTWATAISKNKEGDRAIVFRFVKEFAPDFDRRKQPMRVILVWKYSSEKGMPSGEERTAMDHFEDLLAPLLGPNGANSLAIVSTGENLREWTIYTSSDSNFIGGMNLLLKNEPRFPIEVHSGPDPSWHTYQEFLAQVKP
jgi:hypothetical protein